MEVLIEAGGQPITERTPFETGSVGKTMTGLVFAQLVQEGTVSAETTLGEILPAGAAERVTLEQLATHTSGLPRLPPGLEEIPGFDLSDPYARFGPVELLKALPTISLDADEYSNLGYQVLGYALEVAAGRSLNALVQERVFDPLGMADSGPAGWAPAVQGYDEGEPVPHWSAPLPGDGGWQSSLSDLVAYVTAHLDPRPDVDLSLDVAWGREGDHHFHDGSTGGCSAFVGLNRLRRTGVVVLVSSADADVTEQGLHLLAGL